LEDTRKLAQKTAKSRKRTRKRAHKRKKKKAKEKAEDGVGYEREEEGQVEIIEEEHEENSGQAELGIRSQQFQEAEEETPRRTARIGLDKKKIMTRGEADTSRAT
jgi:hypothetical protein